MNRRHGIFAILLACLAIVAFVFLERGPVSPAPEEGVPGSISRAASGTAVREKRESRSPARAAAGSGVRPSGEWEAIFAHSASDYKITQPFDQAELTALLAEPAKNPRRLMWLIHRAGAERDSRFRYLIDLPELRDQGTLELAVAAYDYSVNGNQKSLDFILTNHSAQEPGSDSDSVVALSFINEWDLTIAAFEAHFAQGTDGAGGEALRSFWHRREYLFPHQYREYRKRTGTSVEPDRR